jgi:ABC-type transport system involved in multi-copper enzyme maturation permease subunit
MELLRAWLTLYWMSFRRLLWSANTSMVALPLALGGLAAYGARYEIARKGLISIDAFDFFSERFVVIVFSSFIVPICALAYGTTSIGGDREDRTLLFLLIRPVPRGLILLAKVLATLPLVVGLVVGSFYLYCQVAGEVGERAFELYLAPVFYMAVAYVCLFHFFAVAFRHSTIIALVYALFMEFFLGNMPGIVKRVAVNYYGRSMMYQLGAEDGLEAPPVEWFEPLSAQMGAWALVAFAVAGLMAALVVFQQREYRDLT